MNVRRGGDVFGRMCDYRSVCRCMVRVFMGGSGEGGEHVYV
jgi:hypothetical protein